MTTVSKSAVVITVSDRVSAGEAEDRSGPTVKAMLEEAGYTVLQLEVIPDEQIEIGCRLEELSDCGDVDLIVTTGGTGFAPRDVTPEATLGVIERRAPGLSERMRAESLKKTPHAALSRGECGIRKRTLIINLPGSPKAARENLEAVLPMLEHGLLLLQGGKPH